jgi:Ca2+-binding RTX toxin-like protein
VGEFGSDATTDLGRGLFESWSPDGSFVAQIRVDGVWAVGREGRTRRRLLPDLGEQVRLSPDWRRYAFSTEVWHGGHDLYVGATAGGRPRRVVPSQCTAIRERCVAGASADETLRGGPRRDILFGGFGRDELRAGGGDDHLEGGFGDDVLDGGTGRDVVRGDAGSDVVLADGDGARDAIECGPGRDRVRADSLDRVAPDCERVRRV